MSSSQMDGIVVRIAHFPFCVLISRLPPDNNYVQQSTQFIINISILIFHRLLIIIQLFLLLEWHYLASNGSTIHVHFQPGRVAKQYTFICLTSVGSFFILQGGHHSIEGILTTYGGTFPWLSISRGGIFLNHTSQATWWIFIFLPIPCLAYGALYC